MSLKFSNSIPAPASLAPPRIPTILTKEEIHRALIYRNTPANINVPNVLIALTSRYMELGRYIYDDQGHCTFKPYTSPDPDTNSRIPLPSPSTLGITMNSRVTMDRMVKLAQSHPAIYTPNGAFKLASCISLNYNNALFYLVDDSMNVYGITFKFNHSEVEIYILSDIHKINLFHFNNDDSESSFIDLDNIPSDPEVEEEGKQDSY